MNHERNGKMNERDDVGGIADDNASIESVVESRAIV